MSARRGAARLAALLCTVATAAGAQSLYTCKDRNGRTLTSDRPIADCAGVMRELGPSGVVRREIAPPLTAEQQRQKDADERARRAADEAMREKHRRDTALLAAYQTVEQIEAARKRSLLDSEASIHNSQERLITLQKERQGLSQEAETYRGKTMPPLFKRKLEDNQALIDDELSSIKARQAEIERVNQRYDDDRRRFVELVDPHH
jgi:hypothetical protein